MRNLYRVYLILILTIFLNNNGFGQIPNKRNFTRLFKSFIEFQYDSLKSLNKDELILMVGANSIDKDSMWLSICFVPSGLLYDVKYEKVYKFEGFKVLIAEDLDKKDVLKQLFEEASYENLNKAELRFMLHPKNWTVTLNKNNEVVSVESIYRFRDVVRKLKKHKVKFAKNFHFIKNMSWQTDDR